MSIASILGTKGDAVVTIKATAPVAEAIDLLARKNFGALVVVGEQDTVAGILSERDIVRALSKLGGEMLSQPVSAIMTADPLTCTRDGTVSDLLQMMSGWGIRHLPVVENGALLGLVSMGDLVKSIVDSGVLDTAIPGRLAFGDEDSAGGASQ